MKMRNLQMISVALVALSFVTAYFAYPAMPERVASHWGIDGKVNGYLSREAGTYFVPALAAVIFALLYLLPMIDPKRENYRLFQKEYDELVAVIIAFLYYIYLLTLAYNMGYAFNLLQLIAPGFGALFLYAGVVLGKAKQTWFVGIRTPWTLSSEIVWNKTHALGSKLFIAAGIVALLGLVVPQMFVAAVAIVIASAVATFAYSYVEYRKEMAGAANFPENQSGAKTRRASAEKKKGRKKP